jgi:hypothetical protein
VYTCSHLKWKIVLTCEYKFHFFFKDRVLVYSPSWCETHYVVQSGLELAILLPHPLSAMIAGVHHPSWLVSFLKALLVFQKCGTKLSQF